jgi:hypothetical protein
MRCYNAAMSEFFKPWMRVAIGEALLAWIAAFLIATQKPSLYPWDVVYPWPLIIGAAIGLPFGRGIRGAMIGLLVLWTIAIAGLLLFIGVNIFNR